MDGRFNEIDLIMVNNNFSYKLQEKLNVYKKNNFSYENLSGYKKKLYTLSRRDRLINNIKNAIKLKLNQFQIRHLYHKYFSRVYEELDNYSKGLLVELISYRILGFRKVKMSTNTKYYDKQLRQVKLLKSDSEKSKPKDFSGLQLYELQSLGYPIKLFFTAENIMQDFVLEQYAWNKLTDRKIEAKTDDVVFDLGGCWGDTALYFAHKVGKEGFVYSFEFIPRNINVFKLNMDLNSDLSQRIKLIPNAVSNTSDRTVYYTDKGPGSKVSFKPQNEATGKTKTVSIDDFVLRNNLEKVDLIKMDIEGAECLALEGALETIKKFKPKLAIAIYHSLSDLALIPNWIIDLNLGYEIHLGHYTIHDEETICFAKVK